MEREIKLFNVPSAKSVAQYKTSAVLTQSFLDFLEENNCHYKFAAKQNNWFLQLILNLIVPFGLIFLMYFFLFRKMGGGNGGGIGSIFSVGTVVSMGFGLSMSAVYLLYR